MRNTKERKPREKDEPPETLLATQAEQAVVGIMLLAPKSMDKIAATLKPIDFYDEQCRAVMKAAFRLREQSIPVDAITILQEVKREKECGESWAAAIAVCAKSVPHTIHLDHYAAQVKEAARRRRLMILLDKAKSAVVEGIGSAVVREKLTKAFGVLFEENGA